MLYLERGTLGPSGNEMQNIALKLGCLILVLLGIYIFYNSRPTVDDFTYAKSTNTVEYGVLLSGDRRIARVFFKSKTDIPIFIDGYLYHYRVRFRDTANHIVELSSVTAKFKIIFLICIPE